MKSFYECKRVLVTGGAGFIGSHLVHKLKELMSRPVSLDSNGMSCPDIFSDVVDVDLLRVNFRNLRPQVVFHLAAQTEVLRSYEEPWLTWQTNVTGTLNVLECCRRFDVESVIVASSDKAYGSPIEDRLDIGGCKEAQLEGLKHNADPYSSSKRAADELAQDYLRWYNLPIKIIRCANTYGPGQTNATTLITNTISRLLRGEEPVIHAGREHVKREWLYIDDAVNAYLRLGASNLTGPFNVGSGYRLSTTKVVESIAANMGMLSVRANLETTGQQPEYRRVQQIGDQGLNSTKFRTAFPDWTTTPFADGLRRTITWHREQKVP